MKTTIDLPDDLLMEAKTLAIRRKTTLKALVEAALRREIRPAAEIENPDPERFEVDPSDSLCSNEDREKPSPSNRFRRFGMNRTTRRSGARSTLGGYDSVVL